MDDVNHPIHYNQLQGIEARDIIKSVLEQEGVSGWEGYCLGNYLKYRLRVGDKEDTLKDIAKSNVYREWFNAARAEYADL